MKSVRLDRELEERLTDAARAVAMSQSEFIRDALTRRCDEILEPTLGDRLNSVIGIVNSSGGRAANSGAAFRRLLAKKAKT